MGIDGWRHGERAPQAGSVGAAGRGEAGRGFVGFLIALVVVVVAIVSLKNVYDVRRRAAEMDDFAYKTLSEADRLKMSADDIRVAIYKKARELGVPLERDSVRVSDDGNVWHVQFAWDDALRLPGYSRPLHFTVDQRFRRFDSR